MRTLHLPFKILALALFLGLILPVLIQDGFFMDGLLYTCVAKNQGNGIGSFWFPISDATWNVAGKTTFHEHPPLVFGIQSIFFEVLGNSMYVERFYSFLTACITALLIVAIWRLIFIDKRELRKFYWLPVILWIITPVAHWSFQNNMQENTMGIFDLLAVYVILKGFLSNKYTPFYILFAGIFVFLASFSKGVPGLFPVGFVGLYWLVMKKPSFYKVAIYTIIIVAVPVLIYYLLLLNPEANEALTFYVKKRLLGRIDNAHTVTSRFHTVVGLFSHLLPNLIIIVILIFTFWKKKIKGIWSEKKQFLLFLLTGLSASLPLMLTMVQKDFYFSHSIPYFALSFGFLLVPGLQDLIFKINIEKSGFKIFKFTATLLLIVSIGLTIFNIGGSSRNKDELHDVHLLGKVIPKNSIISVEKPIGPQYAFRYYFVRYYNISSSVGSLDNEYFLVEKVNDTGKYNGYNKVDANTKKYNLYKRKG